MLTYLFRFGIPLCSCWWLPHLAGPRISLVLRKILKASSFPKWRSSKLTRRFHLRTGP